MRKICLVIFLALFMAFGASYSQTQTVCNEKLELSPAKKEWGTPIEGSYGEVIYCDELKKKFRGEIILKGLVASHNYMLSLNGKPGVPGNDKLPERYGREGKVDFKQIKTDDKGSYNGRFKTKLSSGDYNVKFFVKDMTCQRRPENTLNLAV